MKIDQPDDLSFRPIVGVPSCPTSHLSNLIDILIKSLVNFVTSNLRDSTDFLNRLPHKVPTETILTSFDIKSLYTNIPHYPGIQSMTYWLKQHPESISQRFPTEFIIKETELIFNNNTLTFKDIIYLQKKGTVIMGTKIALSYATLVLGNLENEMYKQTKIMFGKEIGNCIAKKLAPLSRRLLH